MNEEQEVLDQGPEPEWSLTPESGGLDLDRSHDVLIVGAGLIGSATAWLLAQAGCRVVLVDAGRFGGEASAAGAGMLSPGGEYREPSPAAQFALESLAMYPAFVRQLEQASGVPIDYRSNGAIELAYERDRWYSLHAQANVQRRFGIPVELLCASSLRTLVPDLRVEDLVGALFYPHDACVDLVDLLRALRIVCDRDGVKILENSPVESIDAEHDRVTVKLARRRITGRSLVLAAGAWSSRIPLNRHGNRASISASFPVKGHLIGYQLPVGSLGPILRHRHHYLVQRKSGFTIAGSSEENCGFTRDLNPDLVQEIQRGVGSFYTEVSMKEPIRKWAGFRPGTGNEGPVIHRVSGTNVWLAYGHYRNGILLTPATARLVSGEILADRSELQELGTVQLTSSQA